MEVTEGTITSVNDDYTVEQTLFTYSEEEREENSLNKLNAGLILRPKFIPVYPSTLKDLSLLEAAIYGFIDYFLGNNEKFYCTNEQLAEMLNMSTTSVSNAITSLKQKGLIDITYKIRTGGGKTRFVRLTKSVTPTYKNCKSDLQNLVYIENKLIENKKRNIKENKSTTSSKKKKKELTAEQTEAFERVWKEYPQKTHKKDARKHFLECDYDELMFDAKQKKWMVELEVIEKQYVKGGGRWMEEFSPQSDSQKLQDMRRIFEKHMEIGGEDMRERMDRMKDDFPNVDFKKLASDYNEKNKIKFNFTP